MGDLVKRITEQHESRAIAKCMAEPSYAEKVFAGEWCAACDMSRPCLCDTDRTVAEMRQFYEAHRRIEPGRLERAFGAQSRAEPKLIGSWGRDMDGLMSGLYRIATRRIP